MVDSDSSPKSDTEGRSGNPTTGEATSHCESPASLTNPCALLLPLRLGAVDVGDEGKLAGSKPSA